MKGYKVLCRYENGKLASVIADKDSKVVYEERIKNVAPNWLAEKGYHLLIFDTFRNAVDFRVVHSHLSLEIWEVEGIDQISDSLIPLMLIRPPQDEKSFSKIYSLSSQKDASLLWPQGTIMVKEVLLVNKCDLSKERTQI